MQITEIAEHYLPQYLSAWFMVFSDKEQVPAKEKESQSTTPKEEYDVNEAKAYLQEHNIKFAKNMKNENIIKRALENWWGEKVTSPKVDETDLSLLDEEEEFNNESDELWDLTW